MYRQGYVSKSAVAAQLATGSAADFLNRLQRLVDYLALPPGGLARWLPPVSCLTLQDYSALSLRYEALAADAVRVMLAGGLDARWGSHWKSTTVAAFYVTLAPDQAGKLEYLNVFALSPPAADWPVSRPPPWSWTGVLANGTAWLLPAAAGEEPGERLEINDVVKDTSQYGSAVDEAHRFLGAPLQAGLSAALESITAGGTHGRLSCSVQQMAGRYEIWVVNVA
jgi:hypothetical protein